MKVERLAKDVFVFNVISALVSVTSYGVIAVRYHQVFGEWPFPLNLFW